LNFLGGVFKSENLNNNSTNHTTPISLTSNNNLNSSVSFQPSLSGGSSSLNYQLSSEPSSDKLISQFAGVKGFVKFIPKLDYVESKLPPYLFSGLNSEEENPQNQLISVKLIHLCIERRNSGLTIDDNLLLLLIV
jgi:hypothetical protein